MAVRVVSSGAPGHCPVARAGRRRLGLRGGWLLAGAVAVAAIAGCRGRDAAGGAELDGIAGSRQASPAAASAKPLQIAVDGAHTADRIDASGFDAREPATGNQFIVLDVAVRNTDTQARVFSEGKLVAVDEQHERTFTTPVNIFADGYLQLQVLQPSASARGKIVYEVPDDLKGVVYWVPGEGGERILLHLRPALASSDRIDNGETEPAADVAAKGAVTTSSTARGATPEPAAGNRATPEATAARGSGATTSVPPPATRAGATASPGDDQARTLACQALVSRNDPAERARYADFFRRQCAGYAFPPAWDAPAQVARAPSPLPPPIPDPATRWPPRAGPAFDCEQAFTRAEHLICEDSVLSLMDWELTRAYAGAARTADDQAALQREQDDWRRHVRDACTTVRCIEAAYTERTADLTAMTRPP